MKLEFKNQKMLLASVNARAEMHGDEREPAADVKLEADLPNEVLSIFHPELKGLLYHFDDTRPQDLADQGKAKEAGYTPHLRFKNMGVPLKWEDEVPNVQVSITPPGKPAIVIKNVKLNGFSFAPRDGGTISFAMRAQWHHEEKQFGKLSVLVQQEVEVTVEPMPETGQQQLQPEE